MYEIAFKPRTYTHRSKPNLAGWIMKHESIKNKVITTRTNLLFLIGFPLLKGFSFRGKKKTGIAHPSSKQVSRSQANELKSIIHEIVEELESMKGSPPDRGTSFYDERTEARSNDSFYGRTKEISGYESSQPPQVREPQNNNYISAEPSKVRPSEENVVEYDESKFFQPATTPEAIDTTIVEWEEEQKGLRKEISGYWEMDEKAPEWQDPEVKLDEYLKKAERYKKRNQYHDAMKYYDLVLEIDPEHIDALNNKGLILWENRKYKLAIEQFDRVLDLDPDNQDVIINIAASLNRLGKKENALQMYDELLARDNTNSDAWSNKGVILFQLKHFSEAENCFRMAVENDSKDEASWFNLGIVLEKSEKFKAAASAYEHVCNLNPDNVDAKRAYEHCVKELHRDMMKDWD